MRPYTSSSSSSSYDRTTYARTTFFRRTTTTIALILLILNTKQHLCASRRETTSRSAFSNGGEALLSPPSASVPPHDGHHTNNNDDDRARLRFIQTRERRLKRRRETKSTARQEETCGGPEGVPCPSNALRGVGGDLEGLRSAKVSDEGSRDAWISGFNLVRLPGLATLLSGESVVRTTADLRTYLVEGDLIRLEVENVTVRYDVGEAGLNNLEDPYKGLLRVKSVGSKAIQIVQTYKGPSLRRRHVFKRDVSADEIIRRVRDAAALRDRERLAALERKEAEAKRLEDAKKNLEDELVKEMEEPPKPKHNCSGPVLPGTFDALKNSEIVRTSTDVRGEISDGERIQFDGFEEVYVVNQPRDNRTLTLSVSFAHADHANLTACKYIDEGSDGCTPLSGCFHVVNRSHVIQSSVDVTDEIEPGEIIRVHADSGDVEATVTMPRDSRTLTISGPYPARSQHCVKACKVRNTFDGGRVPLCGTVSVTKDSKTVKTTCDLRDTLNLGDLVKIGRHVSPITSPFTDSVLTLVDAYPGNDAVRLKATKQVREIPLDGTISVVQGSKTITTTTDLRTKIRPGDMIKIYQRPNDPDIFDLVAPMDAVSLTIPVPHPGPSAFGLKAYKIAGTLNPLGGTVKVVKGSNRVESSNDLTGGLIVGDQVQIKGHDNVVVGVDAAGFDLDAPFEGESDEKATAFKKGKSAEQSTLEQLAMQKLSCTTIYCLTKIEEAERALTFSFPRALRAGLDGAGGNQGMDGAGALPKPSS